MGELEGVEEGMERKEQVSRKERGKNKLTRSESPALS